MIELKKWHSLQQLGAPTVGDLIADRDPEPVVPNGPAKFFIISDNIYGTAPFASRSAEVLSVVLLLDPQVLPASSSMSPTSYRRYRLLGLESPSAQEVAEALARTYPLPRHLTSTGTAFLIDAGPYIFQFAPRPDAIEPPELARLVSIEFRYGTCDPSLALPVPESISTA